MNFLIDKLHSELESKIEFECFSESDAIRKFELDFLLIYIFCHLWDLEQDDLTIENKENIKNGLSNGAHGDYTNLLKILDDNIYKKTTSESLTISIINKNMKEEKQKLNLENLSFIRNNTDGHRYSTGNEIDLKNKYYDELILLLQNYINKNISKEQKIIKIIKTENSHYIGKEYTGNTPTKITFSFKDYGHFELTDNYLYSFYEDSKGAYKFVPLSPFIDFDENTARIDILSQLKEAKNCTVLYNSYPSISNGVYFQRCSKNWGNILNFQTKDDDRSFSNNGLIINQFKPNYLAYKEFGVKKQIIEYLYGQSSQSSVELTIWGHGGVGKTAVVQSVCKDLFDDDTRKFDYVIFCTAKDRIYTAIGRIEVKEIPKNVSSYADIIALVNKIIGYNSDLTLEENIIQTDFKILIIIDDFETLSKEDRIKVHDLISKLNVNKHKVLITTRNKTESQRFISTDELNDDNSFTFLKSVILNNSNKLTQKKLINELENASIEDIKLIKQLTEGRPIFIMRLADMLEKEKSLEKVLMRKKKISRSENAVEFLYGRYINHLEEENPLSKQIYLAIGGIGYQSSLSLKSLKHIIDYKKDNDDDIIDALNKLKSLRIISDDDTYKVDSEELWNLMNVHFKAQTPEFQKNIKLRFRNTAKSDKILFVLYSQAHSTLVTSISNLELIEVYSKVLNSNNKSDNLLIEDILAIKIKAIEELVDHLFKSHNGKLDAIIVLENNLNIFENSIYYPNLLYLFLKLSWINNSENLESPMKKINDFFSSYVINEFKVSPDYLKLYSYYVAIQCSNLINNRDQLKNEMQELNSSLKTDSKKEISTAMENLYISDGIRILNQIKNNKKLLFENIGNSDLKKEVAFCLYSLIALTKRTRQLNTYGVDLCEYSNQLFYSLGDLDLSNRFLEQKEIIKGYILNDTVSNIDQFIKTNYNPEIIKKTIDEILSDQSISKSLKVKNLLSYTAYLKRTQKHIELKHYKNNYISLIKLDTISNKNIDSIIKLYMLGTFNEINKILYTCTKSYLENYFKHNTYNESQELLFRYSTYTYLNNSNLIELTKDEIISNYSTLFNNDFKNFFIYLKNIKLQNLNYVTKKMICYALYSTFIVYKKVGNDFYANKLQQFIEETFSDIKYTNPYSNIIV